MNVWDEHGPVLIDALIEARLGKEIARGSSRIAYEYQDDPAFIVKQATTNPPNDNVMEWNIWRFIQKSDLERVFGRIAAVSESGRYIVMERLDSITLSEYGLTPDIPSWLGDVKPDSFGRNASGFYKVRDFGSMRLDLTDRRRMHWQRD